MKVALIAGAGGAASKRLIEVLLADPEWSVIGLARTRRESTERMRWVSADLFDAHACRRALAPHDRVTHVFYTSRARHGETGVESIPDNVAMLANVVDAIEPIAAGLELIHIVEGTKWYGMHLGPFKTPAKEDDPRHLPPNFYYDQWDYLVERQKGKRWTYSSARPHAISGFAFGNHSNLTMVIALYAVICRELGLPLCHPGTPGNYTALYQCTDAGLLARAMMWMATTPNCANQAFNITNGDLIRWEHTWPKIARYFGMDVGPRRNVSLVRFMADKGPVWDRIVARHGLRPFAYQEIVSWAYGDFVFTPEYDVISSTMKARQFGFDDCVDTEEMFVRLWNEMRADRVLPP